MFWKLAALVALTLLIASLALALAVMAMKHRQRETLGSMHQWSDLSSLSAEDINRRTLKAAAAMRDKQPARGVLVDQ